MHPDDNLVYDEGVRAVGGDDMLALPVGVRLQEFEILDVVGSGGFGVVYRVQDHSLGQIRAVKEYLPGTIAVRGASNGVTARTSRHRDTYLEGLKTFVDEARTIARVEHPNVLRVFRCLEANGTAYIVMPFYEGQTLGAYLAEQRELGRPITEAFVLNLLKKLLSGLQALHGLNILHRDIKPENIILTRGQEPVLIDFGAARGYVAGVTQTMDTIQSPGYTPPEQYHHGTARQGPFSDLYALGATCYALIAGSKPTDAPARMTSRGQSMLTAREAGRGRFSETLLRTIDKALELHAEERFQSAAEWLDVLEGRAALGAHRKAAVASPAKPSPAKLPWVLGGIGGAGLVAGVLAFAMHGTPAARPASTAVPPGAAHPIAAKPAVKPAVAKPAVAKASSAPAVANAAPAAKPTAPAHPVAAHALVAAVHHPAPRAAATPHVFHRVATVHAPAHGVVIAHGAAAGHAAGVRHGHPQGGANTEDPAAKAMGL